MVLNAPRLVTLLAVALNGPEPPPVAVLVRLPVIFGRPASAVLPAGWVVVSLFNYTERRHYEDH
nr:MAG TPA: hypothetical protein [Caudoviricetes sp.]DAG25402.1 MAG TPA: hypothetical protein [Bacteriophage sp.]